MMLGARMGFACVLLAGTLARAAPEAEAPAAAQAAVPAKRTPSALSLSLLAGGAGLACATATGAVLIESLRTPDNPAEKPAHPEVAQVSGTVTLALSAVSVAVLAVGGAVLASELSE